MACQANLADSDKKKVYFSYSFLVIGSFKSFQILRFFMMVSVKYNYYCNISIVKVEAKHKIPN